MNEPIEGELVEKPDKKPSTKMRVGDGTPGPGRPKGSKSSITYDFKQAVDFLLVSNTGNFNRWLQQVAEGDENAGLKADPARALDLVVKLAEYVAPKQARTIMAGDRDAPVKIEVSWEE